MMSDKPSSIDLGRLRSREKDRSPAAVERADRVGKELGFVDREPAKRRGRKPSPRAGQVHAKVLPDIAAAIAAEARRRGVQQGVVIEEAWALYSARNSIPD